MKRLSAIILGVLITVSLGAKSEVSPDFEVWKDGVIVINYMGREATGMYVDTYLVLTAAHLTKTGVWKFYGCYPFFGWSPKHGIISLVPVIIDTHADLLLLKADKAAKRAFRTFEPARRDEMVWVVGYQYGFLSCEQAGVALNMATDVQALDQRIAPLGSGSPVINVAGAVVGMVQATDEFFTYFVPAGAISTFIERHRRTNDKEQERD